MSKQQAEYEIAKARDREKEKEHIPGKVSECSHEMKFYKYTHNDSIPVFYCVKCGFIY